MRASQPLNGLPCFPRSTNTRPDLRPLRVSPACPRLRRVVIDDIPADAVKAAVERCSEFLDLHFHRGASVLRVHERPPSVGRSAWRNRFTHPGTPTMDLGYLEARYFRRTGAPSPFRWRVISQPGGCARRFNLGWRKLPFGPASLSDSSGGRVSVMPRSVEACNV